MKWNRLSFLFFFLNSVCFGQVVINEFCVANYSDWDQGGDNEDWLELYNPAGGAVNIGGFWLSNEESDPMKWQIPTGTTINANSYLIILLSGTGEYNPNQLVTYKIIHGYSDPEFATAKVTSIEWDLHNARQAQKHNGVYTSQIDSVKDIIVEAYAESGDQETLRSIAETLNIELTRTVEWSATIEVSGTMDVDLLEDVDIEQEIYDNLYVDSNNGNIEIGDTEVCNAREC
jgi:hypothetical protein